MLKDVTFGQYFEGNSFVHKLDPRCKILLLITTIVLIFCATNFYSLGVAAAFIVFVITLTKIPIGMYLKNLKAVLPIIIFTGIINLFYSAGGEVIISFWRLTITVGGVYRAIYMASRIVLLILVSAVLTYTTTPNDLTDAIESLLSPLRFIGLRSAVHTLAMMMTIALRFIPTLVEETQKIMNAQKARGVDFENGTLRERVKALIPILIPLLISAVRRAYELAEAMECRCYNGGEGRVRMKQLTLSYRDIISTFFMIVCIALVFVINIIL